MPEDVVPTHEVSRSQSYLQMVLKVLREPIVILWTLAVLVIGVVLLIYGIPMPSTFALHNPLIYLPFLIFIPIIFIFIKEDVSDRAVPEFKNWYVVIVLCIGLLYFLASTLSFIESVFYEFIIFFLVPFLLSVLVLRTKLTDLGFRGKPKEIVYALFLGLIYSAMVFILVGFNELIADYDLYYALVNTQIGFRAFLLGIAICLFLIALPEEFFFRAILQTRLTDHFGDLRGILLSSLVFGLFHIPANFLTLPRHPVYSGTAGRMPRFHCRAASASSRHLPRRGSGACRSG